MNLDFSDIKVLVVGDFMLDHYITGYSDRMSPEAPVPVLLPKEEYSVPGGAGNVALNLNSMGVQVSCIGVIGNDMAGKTLIELLSNNGIDVSSFINADKHQTTLKKRIYCDKKQVLRIDKEKVLNSSYNEKINSLIKDKIKDCDILILSDYNKGVLNEDTISYAIKSANIPVIIDPKKKNFKRRKRLTRQDYQIEGQPLGVRVPEGSSIDQALQRFRKMMKMTGIIDEYKERRRYEKPAQVRKVQKERAVGMMKTEQKKIDRSNSNKTTWTVIIDGQAR